MRVLVSAIACHPEQGSESGVGWKCALALARSHHVCVLTHSDNREAIERYTRMNRMTNPSFVYFGIGGPYHENRLVARGQSWARYLAWMRESLSQARSLLAKESFDLIHHVTYSTYRVASPLWKLGLPFVFGPVGGGERLPWIAVDSMSCGQKFQEGARLFANALTRFPGKVKQTVRNASVLVASNQATAQILRTLSGGRSDIRILPVVFFTEDQIQSIRAKTKVYTAEGNHLRIFSSGILEGRKGLSIALHAIHAAKHAGLTIDFTIPSRGPEFSYLRNLARRLGLDNNVHFPDPLPREEYWATLLASDVYMAPSLRDNCPATLLEAMLSRCVPIVANCNGRGEIVSKDIGEAVEPARPEQMASDIADRLLKLAKNRAELRRKAEAASDYVAAAFTAAHYLSVIEGAYKEAFSCKRRCLRSR